MIITQSLSPHLPLRHGTPLHSLVGAAPTPLAQLPMNPEIDGLGKAYKTGLEKERHLGKMTRTDTLTGSGECRDKGSSSPAGPAGSELPGEFYTHFSQRWA
jgi:hypothetical protein